MVGTLTTTCANKAAPACVVYGPGNETDVTFSSGSTSLYVSVDVHVLHALPAGTATLYLEDNSLALIEPAFTAPAQLTAMSLRYNALDSALNVVQWPASLTNLDLTGNNMRVVNGSFSLPTKLRSLSLSTNNLTIIDGWRIPPTLLSLDLSFHYIETFNVDAASFAALRDIKVYSTVPIRPTSCAGSLQTYEGAPDARTKEVLTHKICVVASSTTTAPTAVNQGTTAPGTASPASSSSASSATYIGIGVGAAVVVAVLAFLLLRRRRRPLSGLATPSTTDLRSTFQQFQESQLREIATSKGSDGTFAYTYDIRSDPELNGYRIPKRELLHKQICGNGGFAIVYKALFQDQVVAVKELQAVHTRHATHVQAFMHEIQLFSTLQHDNIVRFVGVSWTTLHDLALVTEFLPNGDLRDLLLRDLDTQSLHWTMPSSTFPVSKLQMAVNVIDAITYLHSFEPKILHRDLKSRNILLDATYVAKLTRLVVDETMTREAGTTAWTAPEVLLSDGHYNEKADVYSFGVVLSELDTWQVPYATTSSSQPMSSVQMALLVSTGKLTPTFRDDCPSDILALAKECLAMDPDDRPTAAHVAFALRKLLRATVLST
ncbi:TKL protein kinase [Saprolegnia parasitica CBS 223.65]|uniref:TKL protein kinase n=1 Tax=Saprolegnia parasitica (strain CBS 223.65) TaxID=695850 RepID=A0A067BQ00_SAPPC|nr:TKL protein kinase [Saprolegnia parasitica CBS 223.65]KDO18850.1 TKL protein kinase [Saprolegnia parasitica CBS 223.65]|eukprot:XP_012210433.1 TKL protein kinase [Saprolegnia parasitica CBS 223.65]